jgi:hypothetical protein
MWCSKLQFGSVRLAVRYVNLSASYPPDNELDGKEGWQEIGPAAKTFLYVSVNHFNSPFRLAEYTVIMCVQSSSVLHVIISAIISFKTIFSHIAFPVKQVQTLEE